MEIKQTQIDINENFVIATGKEVQCDTINSNGGDLVFQRNGIVYFTLKDITGVDIIDVEASKGISASYVYGNEFKNRGWTDTIFEGSNSAGTARVEYMRWDRSSQNLPFNANITSPYSITAFDLIETSDKRLKDNIEDVDEDCSEIVKKVNVKTFNYKSDDKKKNHIGFIAQEVKEILPKKFEAVVNEDGGHMGINYGKMSSILWKALQETMNKVEHLESRLFEVESELNEYKKPSPKSKAKAKAKSKKKAEK